MTFAPHDRVTSPTTAKRSSRLFRLPYRFMLLTAGMVTLGMTSFLSAATLTLVDEQLNLLPVRLQSVDEQTITFYEPNGTYQTRQVNDFLQLRLTLEPAELKKIEADKQPKAGASTEAGAVTQTVAGDKGGVAAAAVPPVPVPAADAVKAPAAPVSTWGIVDLIDGQRLVGKFAGSDEAGRIIAWEHTLAGALTFKLDHVRQWRMGIEPAALAEASKLSGKVATGDPSAAGSDRLLFANGDELVGYVSAVTGESVSFKPQGSEEVVAIERVRVTTITLANVPVGQDQPRAMLALADGSRLLVERLVIERGQVTFEPALRRTPERVSLDLSQLRRLDFANPRWQLLPWTALPRESLGDEKVFTTPWPVHEQDGVLYLHAPATVTWTLPAGSNVVAAKVELDVEPADPGRAWADFVVALSLAADKSTGGNAAGQAQPTELARQAMNEQNPVGRLHAVLPEPSGSAGQRTLTLTLDPALNGPIMDRLKVTDAWVVVERRTGR